MLSTNGLFAAPPYVPTLLGHPQAELEDFQASLALRRRLRMLGIDAGSVDRRCFAGLLISHLAALMLHETFTLGRDGDLTHAHAHIQFKDGHAVHCVATSFDALALLIAGEWERRKSDLWKHRKPIRPRPAA